MKILHFSAHGGGTGGGLSAARIHKGMLARGIESRLCLTHAFEPIAASFAPDRGVGRKLLEKITRPVDHWLSQGREHAYESGISTGFVGYDMAEITRRERPDVVHLHWIAGSSFRLSSLVGIEQPIVWRFPDMWAFCALEQYQSDEARYTKAPARPWTSLEGWAWRNKSRTYARLKRLTVATPSRWLASETARSQLMGERPIVVARTACDTDLFAPTDRAAARKEFDLPASEPVILIGADSISLPRKGMDLFVEALGKLASSAVKGPAPIVASFGGHPLDPAHLPSGLRTLHAGRIGDRAALARLYGAADVFVAPSRMENLANTVLESMACGTPTVAFDIGGMPDMIDHGANGWLASPFDTTQLAEGMRWAIDRRQDLALREVARRKIVDHFSLEQEIRAYISLYEQAVLSSDRPENRLPKDRPRL